MEQPIGLLLRFYCRSITDSFEVAFANRNHRCKIGIHDDVTMRISTIPERHSVNVAAVGVQISFTSIVVCSEETSTNCERLYLIGAHIFHMLSLICSHTDVMIVTNERQHEVKCFLTTLQISLLLQLAPPLERLVYQYYSKSLK